MRIVIVHCSLIESIFVREVVLPGPQVVDEFVVAWDSASLDAPRAATEVAKETRWVEVNTLYVPVEGVCVAIPLSASIIVADIYFISR